MLGSGSSVNQQHTLRVKIEPNVHTCYKHIQSVSKKHTVNRDQALPLYASLKGSTAKGTECLFEMISSYSHLTYFGIQTNYNIKILWIFLHFSPSNSQITIFYSKRGTSQHYDYNYFREEDKIFLDSKGQKYKKGTQN